MSQTYRLHGRPTGSTRIASRIENSRIPPGRRLSVRAENTSYEEQGNITQSVEQRRSRQEGVDQEENLFCLEFDSPFSACAGADTGSGSERGESDDDDAHLGCGGSVERLRRQGLRPRDMRPPYEESQGRQARAQGRAFWGGSLSRQLHASSSWAPTARPHATCQRGEAQARVKPRLADPTVVVQHA
jgi:hypothetical protein